MYITGVKFVKSTRHAFLDHSFIFISFAFGKRKRGN